MSAVEGWKTETLGRIAQLTMGQSPDSKYYSTEDKDGMPFLQGCAEFQSRFPTPNLFCSQAKKTAKQGSILFSVRAPVGKINIADRDYIIGRGLAAISGIEVDQTYLEHYLAYVEPRFRSASQGSTFEAINSSELSDWPIEHPTSKPEQTKIAEILSTVDQAIEQTEALIAKQQRIKTGLMQDLLTCGIDEHGNLRSEETHEFKDSPLGRIPVEWDVKRLEECVDFWDGRRVPLKQEDRDSMVGDYPYYGASEIIDYIDRFLFDDNLILVGEDGENVVSRHLPLAFRVSGKIWVNNHAHVLKPVTGIDIDFLVERLEFYDYSLLVSGSAQPKINQRNLRQMQLPIPKTDEQKLIGQLFTKLKEDHGGRASGLSKLRSLKTALMQDLLTGKKRVTALLNDMEI